MAREPDSHPESGPTNHPNSYAFIFSIDQKDMVSTLDVPQSFDTQASQAASENQILSNSLQEQLAIVTWLPEVNTKLGGLKNE